MNVVIISQADQIFLPTCIDRIACNLGGSASVSHVVITKGTPYGKQDGFLSKALKVFHTFGLGFVLFMGRKYLYAVLFGKSLSRVCRDHSIKLLKYRGSVNDSEFIQTLKNNRADLLISIMGGQIFKRALLDEFPMSVWNLHSSDLPKHPWTHAYFWAMLAGENVGVSLFVVDEGVDTGPILLQTFVEAGSLPYFDLLERTKIAGSELIATAITQVVSGELTPVPQSDAESSYNRFPSRGDVKMLHELGKRLY